MLGGYMIASNSVRRTLPNWFQAMAVDVNYSTFLVDGKYQLQEFLGEGAMSAVYRGIERKTNKPIAVKIMKRNLLHDEENVTRFVREVRLSRSITHKNIVRVFDGGTLSTGEPYMIMELLHGKSIAEILEAQTVLPAARALNLMHQAAQGLALAHKRGYVHRDIKPENLMVVEDVFQRECLKVLDFGVAKLSDALQQSEKFATAPGDVLGTPLYMSPEQIRGEKLDGRADVYSLGCVLYQCLCGKSAIQGDNAITVMRSHLESTPPHLNYYAAKKLPEEINSLVQKAIAKDPNDRYKSMAEFAEVLSKYTTPPLIARFRSLLNLDKGKTDGPPRPTRAKKVKFKKKK